MGPERQKIDSIEQKLGKLNQQESKLRQQLQEAKSEYHSAILESLETNVDEPMADYAEKILRFAQNENVDPVWFFKVLNATAYLLIKAPMFCRIPEEAEFYSGELSPFFMDDNFKKGLANMYHGTGGYDYIQSGIPDGKRMFEKGRDLLIRYEEMLGQSNNPKRLSVVYKWLVANTNLLAYFHEPPAEKRKQWLKE